MVGLSLRYGWDITIIYNLMTLWLGYNWNIIGLQMIMVYRVIMTIIDTNNNGVPMCTI